MPVSTAERNRRKRERKKREREEQRKREQEDKERTKNDIIKEDHDDDAKNPKVDIEYVAEELLLDISPPSEESKTTDRGNDNGNGDDMTSVLRRFQARAAILVSDDDVEIDGSKDKGPATDHQNDDNDDDDENEDSAAVLSKRKMRELIRPSIAELKNRVSRADLVEAHDVTAPDPELLLYLKAVPGSVPVPRHWGRKRKYLQGKRGIEKPPFALPDFITKTGITMIRSAVAEDESKMTAKQKNRSRVGPKMGAMDVDYKTLYDAFFKYQTKNSHKLSQYGDLYYEGKEFETNHKSFRVGVLSDRLREALNMTSETSPPPWLINMQRYGPPPSYPNLKIPGLNAPIPQGASYGYHVDGWGKPPVDAFGRPLYGGNPFDIPGSSTTYNDDTFGNTFLGDNTIGQDAIVTSDGKTVGRKHWGALVSTGIEEDDMDEEDDESSSEEEESSSEEEGEEEEKEEKNQEGSNTQEVELPTSSIVPPEQPILELRKDAVEADEHKVLYTVLEETAPGTNNQAGAVFTSNVSYALPQQSAEANLSNVTDAKESEIFSNKRKHALDDEDDEADLAKKFKF